MKMNNESLKKNRMQKNKRKRRKLVRRFLFIMLIFILGTTGVGAYEYMKLNPMNHFKNLKAIGANAATPKYKEKTGVFNILLMGSDARPGDTLSHTDTILLVHADLTNHTYNILSLPRDTRVYMPRYGYTKLTSVQYISQVKNGTQQGYVDAVKAISNLTGVPINYYAEISYVGLQDMVNAIGGINMYFPFNETLTHTWYPQNANKVITKGTHFLNGEMVAEAVHERDSLPGTDYGRQQLQEEAIIGIAKQVMQPANVTKLPALAQSLSKFLIATNMNTDDMISIGLGVKSDFHPKTQIHYRQVFGKSEVRYDDVLKANNDEIVLDPGQLKSVIQKYFTN
jgi:LCP family protein required for cell wall assembly